LPPSVPLTGFTFLAGWVCGKPVVRVIDDPDIRGPATLAEIVGLGIFRVVQPVSLSADGGLDTTDICPNPAGQGVIAGCGRFRVGSSS
jgi:hypothetical protein